MTADDFKLTKFLDLPWPIPKQICLYLEIEQLTELMAAPQLQEMIFDLLCPRNLHILPAKGDVEVLWNHKYVAINKSSIAVFFETYPDISPRTYYVELQGGFVYDVTTCLHQRLNRAEDISICPLVDLPSNVTRHDLRLLFSYPGITTVELDRHMMLEHDEVIASLIPQITGLKTLRLEIDDLTELPFLSRLPHLETLAISAVDYFDDDPDIFEADSTHKMLCKVFSQDSFLFTFTSRYLKFPPLLKSIRLKELCLRKVEVSHLPQTLESLDLSHNKIDTFEFESSTPLWPSNLKSIDLLSNGISDESLKQLLCIKWPPNLETLSLVGNKLTSFEDLRNLPDSITRLSLCGHWTAFEVSHNPDGYPFLKLPKSLRTFILDNDQSSLNDSDESHDDAEDDTEFQVRIKFPPNLEHLLLRDRGPTNCLRILNLPASLKTLYLEKVPIRNLNSYNSIPGDVEEVSWAQLTNLKKLKLHKNEIFTLNNWYPPKLLRTLEVTGNDISSLRSELTPLFNKNCRDMTKNLLRINLSGNRIETIDNDVYLPENLWELTLQRNCFSQFVFTESFASHCSLTRLDLRHNPISNIYVHDRKKKYASQLQDLYIFGKNLFANECYNVFTQLGLRPKRVPGKTRDPLEAWYYELVEGLFRFEH